MRTLSPLKACNDWRHCRLWNVDEDIIAFEGMQWLKTLSSLKCKWRSLSPFEGMQWLKTFLSSKCVRTLSPLKACNDWKHFCLWNVYGLLYRASLHATWLLTGRGSRTVCVQITAGYIRLPPDACVKINRCCVCTDNHSRYFRLPPYTWVRINRYCVCMDNHSGYFRLPPNAWVKISRCCLCTDNHLGISVCHLTHGSGLADVVFVWIITWVYPPATWRMGQD